MNIMIKVVYFKSLSENKDMFNVFLTECESFLQNDQIIEFIESKNIREWIKKRLGKQE